MLHQCRNKQNSALFILLTTTSSHSESSTRTWSSGVSFTFSKIPELWLFILDLKLEDGLKSGSSAVSLLMSQDTWRLAGLEPRLDRSASVSVRPCGRTHTHFEAYWTHTPASASCFTSLNVMRRIGAHRFAVGGRGEAGLAVAVPSELAADVGSLARHGGATRRHEAAAARAQVALPDTQQHAETRDVLG